MRYYDRSEVNCLGVVSQHALRGRDPPVRTKAVVCIQSCEITLPRRLEKYCTSEWLGKLGGYKEQVIGFHALNVATPSAALV